MSRAAYLASDHSGAFPALRMFRYGQCYHVADFCVSLAPMESRIVPMGDKILLYQWVVVVLSVVTCDLQSVRELLPVSGLDRGFQ